MSWNPNQETEDQYEERNCMEEMTVEELEAFLDDEGLQCKYGMCEECGASLTYFEEGSRICDSCTFPDSDIEGW